MDSINYYEVLDVAPDADAADIKKQYRRMARKYHPDVSQEKDAEEKFKTINEAYEVLKDPAKRKHYDALRAGGAQTERPFESAAYDSNQQADPNDYSDFFNDIFSRAQHNQHYQQATAHRGQDQHAKLQIQLNEAYHGCERSFQLQAPLLGQNGAVQYKNKTLKVKIPAGVTQQQSIRLKGQGMPGVSGGPAGDLYLEIDITLAKGVSLEQRDISIVCPVTPWEAALGAKITVPTLAGDVALTIAAGAEQGQRLRLKGRGLPGKTPGDQYVVLQIYVPTADNAEQRKAYEQCAQVMPLSLRSNLHL